MGVTGRCEQAGFLWGVKSAKTGLQVPYLTEVGKRHTIKPGKRIIRIIMAKV